MPHEIVHVPRRIDTARDLPDALGVAPTACVVVEMYETDAGDVVVLLPATATVAPEPLLKAAGATVIRRASASAVSAVTDCTAAFVSPIGLPLDLLLFADFSLLDEDVLYTATGDGSTALKIRASDLLRVTGALVEPVAEPFAQQTARTTV